MTKLLKTDDQGKPVPQGWNPALNGGQGDFEDLQSTSGAMHAILVAGNQIIGAINLNDLNGAATEAKQDTIIGHVDGIEALLTAIRDTSGIKKITDPVVVRNDYLIPAMLSSAARTTSGESSGQDAYAYTEGLFFLNVSAVSGTNPTLDVVVESKDPITNTYFQIAAFTQVTGITKQVLKVPNGLGHRIQIKYTIGGTDSPSFTFSVGASLKK